MKKNRVIGASTKSPMFTIQLVLPMVTGLVFAAAQAPSAALAEQETATTDAAFLVEEEKLARDVYRALYKKWELPIFNNISRAEQRHMDQLSAALGRLGASALDPTKDAVEGVFSNQKLARLYQDLVASGAVSVNAALRVGATIEDLDIKDINEMEKRTNDPDMLAVYARLKCGSRNHMRAFVGQLAARGETYAAQYVTSAELKTILDAPHERCGWQGQKGQQGNRGWRGGGGGQGAGEGWGGGQGNRGKGRRGR